MIPILFVRCNHPLIAYLHTGTRKVLYLRSSWFRILDRILASFENPLIIIQIFERIEVLKEMKCQEPEEDIGQIIILLDSKTKC